MAKSKQAKKVLSMALAAAMTFSATPVLAASNDLSGHWAEKVMTKWQQEGLINGYEDGSMKPNNAVTRAEFVIMMNNALGYTKTGAIAFSDVSESSWYHDAIARAVQAGYCSGYADGTFKPNATITRAEAAVMLANAAGLTLDASGANSFTDAAAIPAWAKGSVGAVEGAGYMSGYPDGSFGAQKSITRAEAVSSLNRVLGADTEQAKPEAPAAAEDMVITESGTVLENQTVTGNLVIDKAVGDGEVYIENVTVDGDIIVKGGGQNSVYINNTKVGGKLRVEKKNVRIHLDGSTTIPHIVMETIAALTSDSDFEGEIGKVTVTNEVDGTTRISIEVPIGTLVIEGKANVTVGADIDKIEVSEDAEGTKLEIEKGAEVGTVVADAKLTLTGAGDVKTLEANASGITVGKNLDVDKTDVASGVSKPTTSEGTTSGGGGGSSSGSSSKPSGGTTTEAETTVTTEDDLVKALTDGKTNIKVGADLKTKMATANFTGTTLTIDFQNYDVSGLSIGAPNATSITLKDGGAGAAGAEIAELSINAPKAEVTCEAKVGTANITAVKYGTFHAKDEVTTLNIKQGAVKVENGGDTDVKVLSDASSNVKIEGTVKDVTVEATKPVIVAADADSVTVGAAGANVTITGETDTVAVNAAATVAVNGNTDTITVGNAAKGAEVTVGTGATAETVTVNAQTNVTVNGTVENVAVKNDESADGTEVSGTGIVTKVEAGAKTTVSATNVTEVEVGNGATATIEANVANVTVAAGLTKAPTINVAAGKTVGNVATGSSINVTGEGTITKVDASAAQNETVKITAPADSKVTVETIVNTGEGTVTPEKETPSQGDNAAKFPDAVKTIATVTVDDTNLKTKIYRVTDDDVLAEVEVDRTGLKLNVTYTDESTPVVISAEGNGAVTCKLCEATSPATGHYIEVVYAGKTLKVENITVLNVTALNTAITAAKDALANPYKVSEDGEDVLATEKWVTPAQKDALEKALATAQGDFTTQDAVDTAATNLQTLAEAYVGQAGKKLDTTARDAAITAAEAKLAKVTSGEYAISTDGSDVLTTKQWVTSTMDAELKTALDAAKATFTTQADLDAAVDALKAKTDAFQPQAGTKPAFTLGTISVGDFSTDFAIGANGKVTDGAIKVIVADGAGYTDKVGFRLYKSETENVEGDFEAGVDGKTGSASFELAGLPLGTYDIEYRTSSTDTWTKTGKTAEIELKKGNVSYTTALADATVEDGKLKAGSVTVAIDGGRGFSTATKFRLHKSDTEQVTGDYAVDAANPEKATVKFSMKGLPIGTYTAQYSFDGTTWDTLLANVEVALSTGDDGDDGETSTGASIKSASTEDTLIEVGEMPMITFTLEGNTAGTTITLYVTQTKETPEKDAETHSVGVNKGETSVTVDEFKTDDDGGVLNKTGTWYVYYKVQGGKWCDSPVAIEVTAARSAKLELVGEKTEITGKVGEELSQDVKITLTNDTFGKDFSAEESVAGWLAIEGYKLPENWTATVKDATTSGAYELTITIACEAKNLTKTSGTLEFLIPSDALTKGRELKAGSINYTIAAADTTGQTGQPEATE